MASEKSFIKTVTAQHFIFALIIVWFVSNTDFSNTAFMGATTVKDDIEQTQCVENTCPKSCSDYGGVGATSCTAGHCDSVYCLNIKEQSRPLVEVIKNNLFYAIGAVVFVAFMVWSFKAG